MSRSIPRSSDPMDTDSEITMLPPNLWSVAYLNAPGILNLATQMNERRVAEVYASASNQSSSPPQSQSTCNPTSPAPLRPSAPPISAYDGKSSNLRAFLSQLMNQLQGQDEFFPNEASKIRYAYQCLGTGALAKMRSYFRCLEDPDVKPEITTMAEFVYALKQRCQDPALIDRASRTVETLHQGNMRFHDFITLFEDSVADSTYSNLDNSYWMPTLERRLSKSLRTLCNAASDVPKEYHSYISYLRKKDAGIEAIDSSPSFATLTAVKPQINPSMPPIYNAPAPATTAVPSPVHLELPVSQGGSAMDLDSISHQRQSNGRLTQRAKDARRTLGRCVRCNKSGHMAPDCNLASRVIANIAIEPQSEEQLKE